MKIEEINASPVSDLDEQFFSIEDKGMIFDILRSKMYSNPIAAICREISCNARDAHREVGKPDLPIHIYLPNRNEPFFKVKDFGPGISPDRMSNIFIKYTASTKRNDNSQTGGFGLGAKTPFAYSDSFTIKTNYNGKQYNYACFIDETKIGKLTLLSESDTTDPNGTEIIVPVKSFDFDAFSVASEQATRYWDVKPIFKGVSIEHSKVNVVLEGPNWSLVHDSNWNASHKAIIDGIAYPLDFNQHAKYINLSVIRSTSRNFHLYFDNGELSLSANREQIYFDKATKEKIDARLANIVAEVKKTVQDGIDACENLWDAHVYFSNSICNIFNSLSFLGDVFWRGFKLKSSHEMPCKIYSFTKHTSYRNKKETVHRHSQNTISFTTKSKLVINDLPITELTKKHVNKFFEEDPQIKSVQVICPNEKYSLEDFNSDIELTYLNAQRLSRFVKFSPKKSSSKTKLIVYKYDLQSSFSATFKQVSLSFMEEDKNKKLFCLLEKNNYSNTRNIKSLGKTLNPSMLCAFLKKNPDISIYAVDENTPQDRIDEEFSDMTDLSDYFDQLLADNRDVNFVEMKFLQKLIKYDNVDFSSKINDLKSKIVWQSSPFMKKVNLLFKAHQVRDNYLLSIYELFGDYISDEEIDKFPTDNPSYDLKRINDEIKEKYPMLKYINDYHYNTDIDNICNYVNMVDASY